MLFLRMAGNRILQLGEFWNLINAFLFAFVFLHISAFVCMFLTFAVISFRARRRWHSANAAAEK